MPVLVTGGAGYIGSHAVLALRDAGWPVAVIDNLSTGFAFAVPEEVPLYEGDIADTILLEQIFLEQGIGAIMHFAGSVVVPESVENPLKYYDNNTVKSRALIEAAIDGGVGHFIFSSTAATYGTPDVEQVSEDTPKQPINPYGWSKLMTEQMLADASAAHSFNYCALRYFNVAGADPDGRTGQSTAGATHLLKVACEAATGKREHVAVFGTDFETPDGTGVRDYIHVVDLAEGHVAALDMLAAPNDEDVRDPSVGSTGCRAVNLGTGTGHSVLEVLAAAGRVIGRPVPHEVVGRRAGDIERIWADPSLAADLLGWRATRGLDEMLADHWRWQQRHPDGYAPT